MVEHWVIDIETLSNMTMLYAEHYKDENINKTFVIHDLRNDYDALISFLEDCVKYNEHHISFNGLGFDAQITQLLLDHKEHHKDMTPNELTKVIYDRAQEIIENQNYTGENYNWDIVIPEWKLSIKQIDLFKLNHFNNPARRSSLKWVQYSMDWYNMQEMPINHTTTITSLEQVDIVIKYCINDVKSTKELYNRSKSLLAVRMKVKEDYNLECLSYSNTKMGSELLLKLYCDKTNKNRWEIKKTGTVRNEVRLADILFPYIKFKSLDFIGFHEILKKKVIVNTKGDFKYSIIYRGISFDYGTGGLHSSVKAGIYRADDEYMIIDADVGSMYPSIACVNHMYPAHLGKEFYEVYKNDIVDVRLAEKKKGKDGNKAIVDGFKESANATFGSSNNKYSWLLDPSYLLQTTINGQLLLTMLIEDILVTIPDSQVLQNNTDGTSIKLKRKDLDLYYNICKKWENITKLNLEYAEYSAMFIGDVNNYIGVYTNGKYKLKGRFEFENLPLYKNKSFLVVRKAVFNFFVNDIPPEQYLDTNKNIFDYCAGIKATGSWTYIEVDNFGSSMIREGKKTVKNYTYTDMKPLSKIIRYYISNDGKKILKYNKTDHRKSEIDAGHWKQTVFNQYIDKPWEEYNINKEFYLDKIYKEIANIVPKETNQLNLF